MKSRARKTDQTFREEPNRLLVYFITPPSLLPASLSPSNPTPIYIYISSSMPTTISSPIPISISSPSPSPVPSPGMQRGRDRFALAVKSGRGLSSAGQHGPYQNALSLSLHSLLWDFMSGSSFREEKTPKVPNVCIPQLPVRIFGRNGCYSKGRGGEGGGRRADAGPAAEE